MNELRARASRVALVCCTLLGAAPAAAQLTISGVDDHTQEVLRAFMTIDDLPCDAPRWWVQRRYRQADGQIQSAMETLGYYHAKHSEALEWKDKCWHASYQIEPGDPVRIQKVDLDVQGPLGSEPRMKDALAGLEIAPEEPYSDAAYESGKTRLLETAQDLGYFDATFTRHQVKVNPETNLAEIDLTLAGGERYHIGEVEVQQQVLRAALFHQFLRFKTGDPYDADALTSTYKNLVNSDYFDRVLVVPDLDRRENGEVPIRVTAAAQTRRSLLVGAGYATDTGPRVRLDVRYRRLNRRGHRLNIHTLVSPVNGEVRGEYRIPYGDPTKEYWFVNGEVTYEKTDTSKSLKRGLGFGRTHQLASAWAETNYVEFSKENFEVGDQDGRSQLLLIGTSWARSTSLDVARPTSGYSLNLDVRGAAKALLSDNDLIQAIIRGRQIVHVGGPVRLLGRVQAGWTFQDQFEALPPSIRFFAGGDNSVRGYGYEQIGPEENGKVVGGKRLLTGSLELDVLFRPNWSVAAFVDSGSAFNDTPQFFTGVGLGVRWYSPLGPLRVDLAHPLDNVGHNLRLHVSLGPDL